MTARRDPRFGVALICAGTVWVTMMSWRGFTERPEDFSGPLLLLAAWVAVSGALLRRTPIPATVATGLQVATTLWGWAALVVATPLVPPAVLAKAVRLAVGAAQTYAAPVPAEPGIHPLLILCGTGLLLVADLVVGTLGRAPLVGLPLLAAYSIPVTVLLDDVGTWVFVGAAGGYLALIYQQQRTTAAGWGRSLARPAMGNDSPAVAARTSAVRIGAFATAAAIALPLVLPTLDLALLDGPGRGDDEVKLTNPMVDLRRDLRRGNDVPLIRMTTDDPAPAYLRIAVLTRFNGTEWTSGDRDIPADHVAHGPLPPPEGVAASVPRTSYDYAMSVTEDFASTWLPTSVPLTRIDAAGDWRYDESTMDFLAANDSLSTAGLTYTMTGQVLDLDGRELAKVTAVSGEVDSAYTELPPTLPPEIAHLAREVTEGRPSPFAKAVALQDWFQHTGGFTYDRAAADGNGTDDLMAFLSEGEGGRTGYCEQFAASMAILARSLGIPSRVAVGFLRPTRQPDGSWEYSAWDMHAWPELYFPGGGWVRFEPTPTGRTGDPPPYTTQRLPRAPASTGTAGPRETLQPDRVSDSARPDRPTGAAGDGEDPARSDPGIAWLPVLAIGLAVAAGVALVAMGPRLLRRHRSRRRWSGGPHAEDAWAELRDSVIDLGRRWPVGRSPRSVGAVVVGYFGAPGGANTPRPRHGPGLSPTGEDALARLVDAVEQDRYAPHPRRSATLQSDVAEVVRAIRDGATRSARLRARWLPASVVRRAPRRVRVDSHADQLVDR